MVPIAEAVPLHVANDVPPNPNVLTGLPALACAARARKTKTQNEIGGGRSHKEAKKEGRRNEKTRKRMEGSNQGSKNDRYTLK